MTSMPVVAVDPVWQLGLAFIGGVVGASVGPFAQGGLNEALGLAVIRYEIGGAFRVRPFRSKAAMVSPSGTRGTGSTKVRAGRRKTLG